MLIFWKNIAGRRLVGLRWWNEVNPSSGDSHWVFESAPQPNEPGGKLVNATDKRFFWLALYCQPGLWVALAIVAVVKFEFIWLTLVGEYICVAERAVWMAGRLTGDKSLLWCLRSQIRWLSHGATSLARLVDWLKEGCILAHWQEMLEAHCSRGSSAVVDKPARNSIRYAVEFVQCILTSTGYSCTNFIYNSVTRFHNSDGDE